ncbi:MAG: ECF-type sigma factor [Planctomycetaceae bacterium]
MASQPKSRRSELSSIRLFASLVDGEASAANEVFHRYLQRLNRLARTRLAPQLNARVDPEDIVMSAYRSFFVGTFSDRKFSSG